MYVLSKSCRLASRVSFVLRQAGVFAASQRADSELGDYWIALANLKHEWNPSSVQRQIDVLLVAIYLPSIMFSPFVGFDFLKVTTASI